MLETLQPSPYTLKQILDDHWDAFVEEHGASLRPAILENIQKVRECRDPNKMGYHLYKCLYGCDDERIVPHSCKSRFCSICGKVATDNWMDKMSSELLDIPYYHIVFTIPQELRNLFAWDRQLLGVLFTSAKDTVLSICDEKYGYIPGIIMVQHTFGSRLNFNSHIHMLVTEGGLSPDRKRWVHNEFIPWDMLKARWKHKVVSALKPALKKTIVEGAIGKEYMVIGTGFMFSAFWNKLYDKVWYVWMGKKLDNAEFTTRYIGRYAKRPAMAESRIKYYDGTTVVFEYHDKVEGIHQTERLPAKVFIARIIRHIHDKHFRVIRYAGMFSTRTKARDTTIARCLLRILHKYTRPPRNWRMRRMDYSGVDPMLCRQCGAELVLVDIYYQSRDGPLLSVMSC